MNCARSKEVDEALDRLSKDSRFLVLCDYLENERQAAVENILSSTDFAVIHTARGRVQVLRDILDLVPGRSVKDVRTVSQVNTAAPAARGD